MTLIELREVCAKIAEKEPEYRVIGFGSVQCRIAKSIRAIQLPEQEPANPTVNNSLTVAKAEQEPVAWMNPISKGIVRSNLKILGVTLDDFDIPLYAAPQSVDALLKQVAELKESLLFVLNEADELYSEHCQGKKLLDNSIDLEGKAKVYLARERAK